MASYVSKRRFWGLLSLVILLVATAIPARLWAESGNSRAFATAPMASAGLTMEFLGSYAGVGAEIAAYDAGSQRLFVTAAVDAATEEDVGIVQIVDISDPVTPTLVATINISETLGGSPNSVAARDGIVAVAVENYADPQANGWVAFYDITGTLAATVTVGAMPDMVAFTPDGQLVLTANEGEPNDDYTVDPEGSVSVVDISGGLAGLTDAHVTTIGFADFNVGGARHGELPAEVRIYGNDGAASVAQDLEPEYLTVSADSSTAWVTLQENNAVAVLDLAAKDVTAIAALGFKDHSLAGNALDASDKDAGIAIQNWPVHGMYQPDAIASYEVGGETFLVTANEGDARDYDGYSEEERVKDLTLDPTVFTDTATLQADENLGRLKTTSAMGDANDDGLYEELYAYGARSFSIWDANGELVFDSADQFEQITAALAPTLFNSQGDAGSFDERSDDKGPEPEGVTVATLGGRVFAFIGLERVGGVMVYDVTNPESPVFVHYFMQPAGHISPEGLVFIAAADSPSGAPLLVMSNEVTGSLAILEVDFEFVLYLPQVFTE